MASIFLSYSREDAPKAKALAKCLERAGHPVWWDRHIQGGSEFSGEIEAALKRSDVVLVLWSEASSRSAWVRDEAAEGRDSGRLVPILAEDCAPPLGFRQIQSISIAGWSGRGNPPRFKEVLAAIEARSGGAEPARSVAKSGSALFGASKAALFGFGALALLLAGLVAWWFASEQPAKAADPVVAVLPFADLSPQRDKAFFAEGVAEAILTVLAKEPGIKVLGRSTAEQLQNASGNTIESRKALGVTHVLEGSARSAGNQLRMSVRLIDAADGRQLWAEEYQRGMDNVFAVQDEISRAVAQRLRGSFAPARRESQQLTSADAYTLYLAARAKMRDRRMSSLQDALKLARQVIAADPDYAPGHALYAELIGHMAFDNYGSLSESRVKQLAMPHVRKAIQLAPQASEGYAALGMISRGEAAIGPLEKAIRLDPARAELRLWLGHAYNQVGRNEEALRQIEASVELEPLWATVVTMHASTLAASGRHREAEAAIAQFERRGGSRSRAAKLRGDNAAYYRGDYSEGIRLILQAVEADPETPLASQSLGWFYRTLGFKQEALKAAQGAPLYTRLYIAGDYARLQKLAGENGAKVWQQPDADTMVDALAMLRDWAAIAALYDANRDSLKQVCRDNRNWTVQLGINIATALIAENRAKEGAPFLACVKSILRKMGEGSVRSPYMSQTGLDQTWAQVHALEGRPERAFTLLEKSAAQDFRTQFEAGLSPFPVFDRYKDRPEYRSIDAKLKQLMAREHAEVLRDRAA